MIRFLDENGVVHNFRSDPKASFGKIVPHLMSSLTSLRRYDFSFYARKVSAEGVNSVFPLKAEFDIVSRHDPAYSGIGALENAEVVLVLRDCIEAVLTERFQFYIGVNVLGLSEFIFDWCGIPKDRDLRDCIFQTVCRKFKSKPKKSLADRLKKITDDPKSLRGIKVLVNFVEKEILTLGHISRLISLSSSYSSSSSSSSSNPFFSSSASPSKMGMSPVLFGFGSYISSRLSIFQSAASSSSSSSSSISALASSSSSSSFSSAPAALVHSPSTAAAAAAAAGALPDMIGDKEAIISNPVFKLYELCEALRGAGVNTDSVVINPFIYAEQCKGFMFKVFEGEYTTLADSLTAMYAKPGETLAEGYRYDDIVTTKEHPTSGIGLVINVDSLTRLALKLSCGSSGKKGSALSGGAGSGTSGGGFGALGMGGGAGSGPSTPAGLGGGSQGGSGPSAIAGFARNRLCGGGCGDFRPTRRVLVCSSMNSWAPVKMAARLWRQQIHTEIVTGSRSTDSFMPIALAKMADWVVEISESYTHSGRVLLRKTDKTTTSKNHRAVNITEAAKIIIQEALFKDYAAATPDRFDRGAHAFAGPDGYTTTSPPPQIPGSGKKGSAFSSSGGSGISGAGGSGGAAGALRDPAEDKFEVTVLGSRPKAWVDKNTKNWKGQLARALEGIHFEGTVPCFALELPLEDNYKIIDNDDDYMESTPSRVRGKKAAAVADEKETLRKKYRQELIAKICSVREQVIIIISFSSKSTIQFTVLGQARISSIQKIYTQPKKPKGKARKYVPNDYS